MSFKYFVPQQKNNPWEEYWSKTEIENEVKSCLKDELLTIITKYIKKNDKTLDAGCGLGRWIIYFSKRGYDISGVDNFQQAILRLKKFDERLKVRVANICHLPFKDNEFCNYLSFGVVEHFEEGPANALFEAKRILKNGGIIILETPYDNFLRKLIRLINHLKEELKKPIRIIMGRNTKKALILQFYEYRYTNAELKNFLKKLNFKIIASYSKDLISSSESIGLWSDFPVLRLRNDKPFKLNSFGRLVKKMLLPFKNLYAGCTIIVAKKYENRYL